MSKPLALLLIVLALAAPGCDRDRVESMQALAAGMKWYHDGVHFKARSKFKEAVDIDPTNDQAHFYLGMVLFHQLKETGPAEAHLRRAVELDPKQPEYLYQLASVLLASKGSANDEAEALLRQAIALKPDHAHAHYRLGTIMQAKGKDREAITFYMKAIELDPRFVQPYLDLARLYDDYDYTGKAIEVLENAVYNCPDEPEAHNELGRLLELQGRPAKAMEHFRKAIELNPDMEGALFNLGMACARQGNKAEAERYLKRYLARADRAKEPYRVDSAEAMLMKIREKR